MIWIIGGTSEARELLELISETEELLEKDLVLTLATEEGKKLNSRLIGSKLNRLEIVVRRMDTIQMKSFIEDKKINTVIDLSHPYAVEVSKNAKEACHSKGCRYIRFTRIETDMVTESEVQIDKEIEASQSFILLKDTSEAKSYLKNIKGTVFFTTGSKDISEYESVKNKDSRFIYRILPAEQSIKISKENEVSIGDIVAIMGPFTTEFNKAMFENYRADYVVMKNSGEKGGTAEKIQAAKELGIKVILIGRPEDEGISNLKEILELIK